VIDLDKRTAFLKKLHLFRGMEDEQVRAVAESLQERSVPADTVLVKQGERAESFYIIYEGRFEITRREDRREYVLATFVGGDYFGEEGLLTRSKRSATVKSTTPSIVLIIDRQQFNELLRKAPDLRHNLEIAVASRRMARRMRFKWVEPGEVIYFLARKHPLVLAQSLFWPVVGMIVPILIMLFGFINGSLIALLAGGGLLALLAGTVVWRWLDWGNDYYIVTNRRVVWIEKIIALYDSRQEAPLSTILSVGVETSQIGRWVDFGDVVVRTFVGKVVFTNVNHPRQAGAMVEEHWKRTQERSRAGEEDAMKQALREKLGLPRAPEPEKKPQPEIAKPPAPVVYKPGLLTLMSRNIFSTRFEGSGTITYRKHPFVLVRQSWMPGVLFILLVGVLVSHWAGLASNPDAAVLHIGPDGFQMETLSAILLGALLFAFGWWLYQYVDWTNDIFQVTPDQIIDIDRKPLGSERRRAAPLENILSTDYERIGLIGNLLNFGTVRIVVGGAQLDFEDVFDPASVQADIDRRRLDRIAKKKAAEQAAERERMAEWLATYHRSAGELRDLERLRPPDETE